MLFWQDSSFFGVGMRISCRALTFDDVLLLPRRSSVLPREVSLTTQMALSLPLHIPIISAAMDTVTESHLAIALAQEGGIGVIHKNCSIVQQAKMVERVKRFEAGVVRDPVTVPPHLSVREVLDILNKNAISSVPVVENGVVAGIVTHRDFRFENNLEQAVRQIMTPRERLVTVREGASLEEALALMHRHRLERVLVVNEHFELKGLITAKDILKAREYPLASKDAHGRLLAAAAVGVGADFARRAEGLAEAGADCLVVDSAHGHSENVLRAVTYLKRHFPQIPVIAGNVATREGARDLVEAGADGIKVGIGPGSICTTRVVAGIGVPQITAISWAKEGAGKVPLIADGGIRYSGDAAKALAAGASAIMVGNLLAGTSEAPGEVEIYQGRPYKAYRGMGSLGAMGAGAADRYFQDAQGEREKLVPEGVEGRVPYKGPVSAVLHQLLGGVRASMGYLGCASLKELHESAEFVEVSPAGVRESHVHDVEIVKEAPNYHLD